MRFTRMLFLLYLGVPLASMVWLFWAACSDFS